MFLRSGNPAHEGLGPSRSTSTPVSFDTLPSGKVVHLPCGWPMAPSFPGQGQSPWPQQRCELASSMRTTPKWPNGQDGRWRMFCMIKSKHKQAHTRIQTKTREISGIIVGLEAQFVVTAKEGVFRLGLRFPVGLHSVLSLQNSQWEVPGLMADSSRSWYTTPPTSKRWFWVAAGLRD